MQRARFCPLRFEPFHEAPLPAQKAGAADAPAVAVADERLFPQEAANREYEVALKALDAELKKGVIDLERLQEAQHHCRRV